VLGTIANMRATAILAIVAIVAALGAVTSLIPIHQVSAQGKFPGGGESSDPCQHQHPGQAGSHNPHC
jgi:hypothetical protein